MHTVGRLSLLYPMHFEVLMKAVELVKKLLAVMQTISNFLTDWLLETSVRSSLQSHLSMMREFCNTV